MKRGHGEEGRAAEFDVQNPGKTTRNGPEGECHYRRAESGPNECMSVLKSRK